MNRLLSSVSLDLDNQWSYMKTHGDAGWEALPSYLSTVVPRVCDFLAARQLKITWFIVGQDAAKAGDRTVLQRLPADGHEVGNHSFHHEPWLHLYTRERIHQELADTENAIQEVMGVKPNTFRGPGFSLSPLVLDVLMERGYLLDASTFPTYLGPLARAYYFATSRGFTEKEKRERAQLFGKFADGRQPLKPYYWHGDRGQILEIPVTTMPIAKVPIHLSYILYLACYSEALALTYWTTALRMCYHAGVELSLLLHPLDFLGGDDVQALDFFPAMKLRGATKMAIVARLFDRLEKFYQVIPMGDHAHAIAKRGALPKKRLAI
ncbi:MAG: polysaccharide deacetylase family protein [Zavarzinella sp.]